MISFHSTALVDRSMVERAPCDFDDLFRTKNAAPRDRLDFFDLKGDDAEADELAAESEAASEASRCVRRVFLCAAFF